VPRKPHPVADLHYTDIVKCDGDFFRDCRKSKKVAILEDSHIAKSTNFVFSTYPKRVLSRLQVQCEKAHETDADFLALPSWDGATATKPQSQRQRSIPNNISRSGIGLYTHKWVRLGETYYIRPMS
jgi:hypothetical protein